MPSSSSSVFALLIMVIVVAGCATGDAEQAAPATLPPTPTVESDTRTTTPGTTTVTGRLDGDPALEGGCIWLDAAGERYELRLPEGFDADADALQISSPEGTAFAAGDTLTVTGTVREDLVTICQVGPVIEISEISRG